MTAIIVEVAGMIGGSRWLCHGRGKKDTWTQVATEGVRLDSLETVQETLDPVALVHYSLLLLLASSFVQCYTLVSENVLWVSFPRPFYH